MTRYWARRRKQNAHKEPPDRLVAMETLKEEVTDMLSEVRNILKSIKANKSRERVPFRLEEGGTQVGKQFRGFHSYAVTGTTFGCASNLLRMSIVSCI